MNRWIDQILAFSSSHPLLLGLIVFVSAAAEAIIVVGALVPGTAVLLAASGLAGATNLLLWPLVLWATAGAALGDGVSYWIGHRYGRSLGQRWPLVSRPQILERGTNFFERHGAKSVFFARFVPGIKAVVPAVAGMVGMPVSRFLAANLSSGVLWAAGHVLPAAAAGVLLATIGSISSRFLAALAAAFVALLAAFWLARLLVVRAAPWLVTAYQAAIHGLSRSRSQLLRRIARAGDPGNPKLIGAIAWGALLVLALTGFVGVIQDIVGEDPFTRADIAISQFVQSVRTPPLDQVMILITEFGDGIVVGVTVATLLLFLVLARRWRSAVLVGSAFVLAAATVPLIKLLLHRPRPIEIYSGAELFAFPSGHSTFTTLLFATLALLISPQIGRRSQVLVWTAVLLAVIAVGSSRIYLGAHWPSDVTGGVLYGFFISCLLALLLRYKTKIGIAGLWSAFAAGLVFLGFGAIHGYLNAEKDIARYQPVTKPTLLSEKEWLDSGWGQLPRQRIDLFGETEERLSLQYTGRPEQVAEILRGSGWQPVQIKGLGSFLKLLSPKTELGALPPWSLLHDGRWPVLTLTKATEAGDQRFIFRLWPSDYALRFPTSSERVLVGSVTQETVTHPYGALTAMFDEPAPSLMRKIVEILGSDSAFATHMRSLPSGLVIHLVTATTADGTRANGKQEN